MVIARGAGSPLAVAERRVGTSSASLRFEMRPSLCRTRKILASILSMFWAGDGSFGIFVMLDLASHLGSSLEINARATLLT